MEMTTDLRHFLSVTCLFKPLLKAVFPLTHPMFSIGFKDKKCYFLCA